MEDVRGVDPEKISLLTGEQSNSAAIVDDRFFIKLYRRLEQGTNPETELLKYLTEANFKFTPRLHGKVTFQRGRTEYTLGILQEALPVEADGWEYALEVTDRYFDRVAETKLPANPYPEALSDSIPAWLEEVGSEMLSMARVLGIRTAEMHLALAKADAPGLSPVEGRPEDTKGLARQIREEAERMHEMLDQRELDTDAPAPDLDAAAWTEALDRLDTLADLDVTSDKIRLHGDYHLGQVLQADGEFYILDFEGEPARSIEERRQRGHALRDVAGMLRSLDYAVLAAWKEAGDGDDDLLPWADILTRWCQTLFLHGYFDTAGDSDFVVPEAQRDLLLWSYLFEKVIYEVRYELNHRPHWAWLPLRGLERLLDAPDALPRLRPQPAEHSA
jgi:maltose alpha-D-glucosyltransferase/alpha-amylase